MRDILALTAAVVGALGIVPYMIDVVKQRTKPNIVSWVTWGMLTGIGTAAAFASHEPRSALLTLGDTLAVCIVVVLGFKYGKAKLGLFDALCQASALLGLLLWLIFNSPLIAIMATVGIDFIAALPTIKHSWLKPQEETWQTFLFGIIAATMTLLSLSRHTVNGVAYPLYLMLSQVILVTIIVTRRLQKGITLSRHSVHETLHE